MNAAITTTGTRTWNLVKAHYLAAALGAALALSAVAGVDNVRSIDFGGSSGRVTAPASTLQLTPAQTSTIYIVSSGSQAAEIIAESQFGPARQIEVWVVNTPELEAALNAGMTEASLSGSTEQFIDLRGR